MSKRIWPGLPPQSDPDYEKRKAPARPRPNIDYHTRGVSRGKKESRKGLIITSLAFFVLGLEVGFSLWKRFECIDCTWTRILVDNWSVFAVLVGIIVILAFLKVKCT